MNRDAAHDTLLWLELNAVYRSVARGFCREDHKSLYTSDAFRHALSQQRFRTPLARLPNMTNRTLQLDDNLYRYLLDNSLRESDAAKKLRAETASLPKGRMQIAPEQGQFIALLARLIGARRTLEIGVFTGYSSLCVAEALPDDGLIVACDIDRDWTDIARRHWQQAGVADKIDLRLAPALDTLDALLAEGGQNSFDLAFIDADKQRYQDYYERCLQLVRPGGVILLDNVLWSGRVADPEERAPNTRALRALNSALKDDPRIWLSLLPLGDGMTIAMKR